MAARAGLDDGRNGYKYDFGAVNNRLFGKGGKIMNVPREKLQPMKRRL